jgi:hypothetical protein
VEPETNPDPLMVRANELEPACTKSGEIEVMAGPGLYVLPVIVVVETTVLSAGFGSPCGALTVAVFVNVPADRGVIVI